MKYFLLSLTMVLPASAAAKDLPFETIELPYSHAKRATLSWSAAGPWSKFWTVKNLSGCGYPDPPPPPPAVDFAQHEVVAIFHGKGNERTPIPKITKVEETKDAVIVEYDDGIRKRKERGALAVSAMRGVVVCPKIVAKIPRTGKKIVFKAANPAP